MIARLKLLQEKLRRLVKVIPVSHPIDIGRFTVRVLYEILPRVKKELGIDFDALTIYPGPQPRESGDIELYKDGKLVEKISVKTDTIGNFERKVDEIWFDLEKGKSGLIVTFMEFKKKEESTVKMVLIYINKEIARIATKHEVKIEIHERIKEKKKKEKYDAIIPIAASDAILFEYLTISIEAGKKADKAMKYAKEAMKYAKSADEKAEKAMKYAEEAMKYAKKAFEISQEILEIIKKLKKK